MAPNYDGEGQTDAEWAEGYRREQTAWTGMRPEDYPPGPTDAPRGVQQGHHQTGGEDDA